MARRILIILPGRLSDLVLSSITFYPLQCAHPEVSFSILIAEPLAPVISDHPSFEAVISFSRGKSVKDLSTLLGNQKFDSAVALGTTFGIKPVIAGLGIEEMITEDAGLEIPHRAELYLRTLEQLGKPLLRSFEPWLPFDAETCVPQSYFPNLPEGYVCLNLQSDQEAQCWGMEAYMVLAEKIIQKGYPIVVVGENLVAKKRLAFMNHFKDATVIDMTSLPLGSALMSVLAGGLAMVSSYSGYATLGAALGIPTVTLIGSCEQDYGSQWWSPLGAQAITVCKNEPRPWWRSKSSQAKKNLSMIKPDEVLKLLYRWIG